MTCGLLSTLPAELYSAILSFVSPEELQRTAYALVCALPSRPVPREHLFTHIRLTYPEQALRLYLHLNKARCLSEDISPVHWVYELSLETWSVDADVFINLVQLLPNLGSLSLRIGPNNFSPEHLEELFTPATSSTQQLCFPKLRYLGLRFRPYVQKATYFQFLKGAYFDSALAALSRWPESRPLPVLSIVQDPLDHDATINHYRQSFAQPIVFFRLDVYLSVLLHSRNLARSLSSLRLRIPSRAVARPLCMTPPHVSCDGETGNLEQHGQNLAFGEIKPRNLDPSPPLLRYLDLSTCNVLEGEVDMILVTYHALEHLVLDDCYMLRGELREGGWAAMGKRCALVGVRRAKEREKKVKAWLESHAQETVENGGAFMGAEELPTQGTDIAAETQRPTRRGRRGLATATISIRDREPRMYGPTASASASASHSNGNSLRSSTMVRIRILPPLPRLRSLSTTPSSLVRPEKYAMIRSEFETGWAEGAALLRVTRARLRANAGTGVRVMEFSEGGWTEEGLSGLSDVDKWEEVEMRRPVLCLAGGKAEEGHTAGCGHEVGRQIWKGWDGVL